MSTLNKILEIYMLTIDSPDHFDSFLGPIVVCFSLMVSLIVNFAWKISEISERGDPASYVIFQSVGQAI